MDKRENNILVFYSQSQPRMKLRTTTHVLHLVPHLLSTSKEPIQDQNICHPSMGVRFEGLR